MDPTTRLLMAASSSSEATYVEDVFSTWLYTGNGSTQTITNEIDLAGEGGLVWIKQRNAAAAPYTGLEVNSLYDSARPSTQHRLRSDSTQASQAYTSGHVSSFNSDGFTLDQGQINNTSADSYASWTFRKAEKFFDVVTYTGNGTAGRTVAHNLGSVPGCIIVKPTSQTGGWGVYHRSIGGTKAAALNGTGAFIADSNFWNNTDPTSTNFTVGTYIETNQNGVSYVAYLFAHDAGGFGDDGTESVIKCGTFSGTGFVDLGWEPQWLLIKPYSQTWNWEVYDNMRGMGQPGGASTAQVLNPNLSNSEAGGSSISFEANGFTQTTFGSTYPCIYIAIRRGPMKTPEDATKVFSMVSRSATGAAATVSGFTHVLDTLFVDGAVSGFPTLTFDRLRGATNFLDTTSTSNEQTNANTLTGFDQQTGYTVGSDNSGYGINYVPGGPYINYGFRRAPGFFDVVAYTGTGSVHAVSHNLGVVPELIIIKRRNNAENWPVYCSYFTSPLNQYPFLNDSAAPYTVTDAWGSHSSTVFTIGSGAANAGALNVSGGLFIAYLFASCPGVSKVGSYTGTGTTLDIDCGFTTGARFVLIKRADAAGDWYVWDTARGIVSGNDPYLLLNDPAAEVYSTDYIDPLSTGFQISSTAPAAINASGGSYIFLAIA